MNTDSVSLVSSSPDGTDMAQRNTNENKHELTSLIVWEHAAERHGLALCSMSLAIQLAVETVM